MLVRIRPIWQISLKFLMLYSVYRVESEIFPHFSVKFIALLNNNFFLLFMDKSGCKVNFRFSHVKNSIYHSKLYIFQSCCVFFTRILQFLHMYIHSSKRRTFANNGTRCDFSKIKFWNPRLLRQLLYIQSRVFVKSNIILANRTQIYMQQIRRICYQVEVWSNMGSAKFRPIPARFGPKIPQKPEKQIIFTVKFFFRNFPHQTNTF